MIKSAVLAGTIASGLLLPTTPALYVPAKPAIVKAENLDFSKHMLIGMPITMGMLAPKGPSDPYFIDSSHYSTAASNSLEILTWSHTTTADTTCIVAGGVAVNNANTLDMDFASFNGVSFGTFIVGGGSGASARLFVLFDPPIGTYTMRAEVDATNDRIFWAGAMNFGNANEVNSSNGVESSTAETLSVSHTTTKRSLIAMCSYVQQSPANTSYSISLTSPSGGVTAQSGANTANSSGRRGAVLYSDVRDPGTFNATSVSSVTVSAHRTCSIALAA